MKKPYYLIFVVQARKKAWVLAVAAIIFASYCCPTQAGVMEFPMPDPSTYHRVIGPAQEDDHSQVDMYVENHYDPLRWKEWYIEIWIPIEVPDMDIIQVDYDNTIDHSNPEVLFPVNLVPITGPPRWETYKGFSAQGATTPVGSGLPYDVGNPRWVSFHFYIDDGCTKPFGYYVDDWCIPEPATITLLGLAGIALLRKRS